MSNILVACLELALLAALFVGCLMNARRYPSFFLLLPFAIICAILTGFGWPKSSYHLLLIGLFYFATRPIRWKRSTRQFLRLFVSFELLFLVIVDFVQADWSMQSKTAVPQSFYLWGTVFLLTRRGLSWARILAIGLIVLDIGVSIIVSARGILFGSAAALFFIPKRIAKRRNILTSVLVISFLSYILIAPLLMLFVEQDVIIATASNAQRSAMNNKALIYSMQKPVALDETSVFDSVSEFRYSYDGSKLTVHNLFLAFGLFNGFFPALVLWVLVIKSIRRLSGSHLLPVGVYLYFIMILGPDSFTTRFSLMLLAVLIILRHQSSIGDHLFEL